MWLWTPAVFLFCFVFLRHCRGCLVFLDHTTVAALSFVFLWVPSNFWVSIMQNVFENRNLGWWVKGLTLSQFCECKVDAYGFLLSGIIVSTYCFLVCHRGFLMLSSSSYYTQGLLHSVNVYFHIWCLGTSCSPVWTRKSLLHLLVVMVLLSVVWAHFQYQGCIAQGDQLRYIVSQDIKTITRKAWYPNKPLCLK